jgi:outer membrane autotransporter protein
MKKPRAWSLPEASKIRAQLSLYAQLGYQLGGGDTDGGRRQGVQGSVGLRYTW